MPLTLSQIPTWEQLQSDPTLKAKFSTVLNDGLAYKDQYDSSINSLKEQIQRANDVERASGGVNTGSIGVEMLSRAKNAGLLSGTVSPDSNQYTNQDAIKQRFGGVIPDFVTDSKPFTPTGQQYEASGADQSAAKLPVETFASSNDLFTRNAAASNGNLEVTPATNSLVKYAGGDTTTSSIVDYLASIKQPFDFVSRSKLATQAGIQNYQGTAEQNTKLLALLRGQDKSLNIPNNQLNSPNEVVQFSNNMTTDQKNSINILMNGGQTFNETDAKNYAYAIGNKDYTQFVGKTPYEVLKTSMLPATPANGTSYTVSRGDTLSAISKKYGVSVNDILSANPAITNPNLIYTDQKIVIPQSNTNIDPAKNINDQATFIKNILDKSKENTNNDFTKPSAQPEQKEQPETNIIARKSMVQQYQELLGSQEIKDLKSKIIDVDSKLKDIDLQEAALVEDIRKEVAGEAPESYIKALAAKRASDLYPKKSALLAQKDTLQTQLTNSTNEAKNIFDLTLKDQENSLTWLKTYAEAGLKLDKNALSTLDASIGVSGFSKAYMEATVAAKKLKTETDQIDLMGKLINLQTKLPAGKSFEFNGATYESMSDPTEDIQVFRETDAKTGKEVIIEYNKKTRGVVVTPTEVSAKKPAGSGGGTTIKESYFTRPKADGSIGYYFGDAKQPEKAQELTAKAYLEGSSKAEGVLNPNNEDKSKKKAIGNVKVLILKNADPEDIKTYWLMQGYELNDADFQSEVKNYSKPESWWQKIF